MSASPTGSSGPWSEVINSESHGALVSITTCLMLTGMVLFSGIRLAIRWPWKQLLGFDDFTTIVASIFAIAQSIAIFAAVHDGLGRRINALSPRKLDTMEKAIYAGDLLFILVLTGSKLAISLLLLRLSSSKQHILAARTITLMTAAWGFVALLAVAIRKDSAQPWNLTSRSNAAETTHAWIGVGATSILLEIALVTFPVFLVWDLQMPTVPKITVLIGFGFRIPTIVVTILRLISIHHTLGHGTEDLSWQYVVPTIYTEIEMHYSLIAATIPCMRIFLKSFSTGYLGTTADHVDPTLSSTGGKGSYVLSSISRNNNEKQIESGKMKLRPDAGVTTSRIAHTTSETGGEEAGSMNHSDDGSDRIIIKKTVHVDYGY